MGNKALLCVEDSEEGVDGSDLRGENLLIGGGEGNWRSSVQVEEGVPGGDKSTAPSSLAILSHFCCFVCSFSNSFLTLS